MTKKYCTNNKKIARFFFFIILKTLNTFYININGLFIFIKIKSQIAKLLRNKYKWNWLLNSPDPLTLCIIVFESVSANWFVSGPVLYYNEHWMNCKRRSNTRVYEYVFMCHCTRCVSHACKSAYCLCFARPFLWYTRNVVK